MNQAFQATQVDTPQSSPLKPVLLDLNESLINNLLIVQKPAALETGTEEHSGGDITPIVCGVIKLGCRLMHFPHTLDGNIQPGSREYYEHLSRYLIDYGKKEE